MRRTFVVTIALVLLASLLGPAVFADRGGRGVGQGNTPQSQGPANGPAQDHEGDQDRIRDQTHQRDQDCPDCDEGPVQERKQDAKQEAKESARAESAGNGAAQGNAQALQQGEDSEGDDEAPKPGNGNRPESPPGQAVSAAARSRFTNEGEDTENTHRVQMQIQQSESSDDGDDDNGDDPDETDVDRPGGLAQRIWAWQRALQNSAQRAPKTNNGVKPFMMVGQIAVDEDGNLVIESDTIAVSVWRGNRLTRDYYDPENPTPISVTVASEVRLVSADGVTVCEPGSTETCLAEWLASNPDAYVSVWGRLETVGDDDVEGDGDDTNGDEPDEVFVAYRITVTVPDMDGDEPTKERTIPAPTATPTTD